MEVKSQNQWDDLMLKEGLIGKFLLLYNWYNLYQPYRCSSVIIVLVTCAMRS